MDGQPRRRRLLRTEDRHQGHRRPRPRPPVRDDPARLPAPDPLRPQVPRPRRRLQGRLQGRVLLPATHHHPPRHARLRGAHDGRPHGALGRQVALLDLATTSHDRPRRRRTPRLRPRRQSPHPKSPPLRRLRRLRKHPPEESTQRPARTIQLHPRRRRRRNQTRRRQRTQPQQQARRHRHRRRLHTKMPPPRRLLRQRRGPRS
mmetsp:Transcript_2539/g.8519  ORF Transcript_2539/g.8519 Transcript_2539/m.8519 type:complete len:203 (+) Transcript_2539:2098-2706(+)